MVRSSPISHTWQWGCSFKVYVFQRGESSLVSLFADNRVFCSKGLRGIVQFVVVDLRAVVDFQMGDLELD